jgi:hypothetical protein
MLMGALGVILRVVGMEVGLACKAAAAESEEGGVDGVDEGDGEGTGEVN